MEELEPRFNSQPEATDSHKINILESPEEEITEEVLLVESQTQREEVPAADSHQTGVLQSPENQISNPGLARQLLHAAMFGDVEVGREILRQDPSLLNMPINDERDSALHVAAATNQVDFVKMLLDIPGVLADLKNKNEKSPFCLAVAAGASNTAYFLLEKAPSNLIDTRATDGMLPCMRAALIGNREMTSDLYDKTNKSGLQETDAVHLFFICIRKDLFDVCLKMMNDFSDLQLESKRDKNEETALHILVQKPNSWFAFEAYGERKHTDFCSYLRTSTSNVEEQAFLALLNKLLDRVSKRKLDDIKELIRRPSNLMIEAAELGNYEFLVKVIHLFPDLIREKDTNNHTIFHVAIINRYRNIFNLVYREGLMKSDLQSYEDEKGNNLLHLVADLPSSYVLNRSPGEYAQVREEILWFKEIEKFVCPPQRWKQNIEKKTPRDVFLEKHKTLIEAGGKEIKRKAVGHLTLATLVLPLIYSAVVSRAEQLQIGSVSSNGNDNPNARLLENILLVTNVIAMCFSLTSIGALTSILVSPSQAEDFLQSLPFRFSVKLISLFVTVISFITSFCVTAVIAYST